MATNAGSFLEINSDLVGRSLLLKDHDTDVNNFRNSLGLDSTGQTCKWVLPSPGFCLKCVDDKENKAFVNFCTADEIPEPLDVTRAELIDILEDEENYRGFRLHMSLLEPHKESDNLGKVTQVYDVAINPNFYEKVHNSTDLMHFLFEVTFSGLNKRFGVQLKIGENGPTVLKNRKAIGKIRPHLIKTPKKENTISKPKKIIEDITGKLPTQLIGSNKIPYRFVTRKSNGKHYFYGKVDLHVASLISEKDVSLEIGEDRLVVNCHRTRDVLDVFLPLRLDNDKASGELDIATQTLHIFSPLLMNKPS